MIRDFDKHYEVIRSIPGIPKRVKGIQINGWRFENSEEVVRYFSYYGKHILEGTIMVGGGYNAYEHVDGSVLSSFLHVHGGLDLLGGIRGIPTKEKSVIHQVEEGFYNQNPLWSGKIGGEDLMQKMGWYKHGILSGVVAVLVKYTISGERNMDFNQLYLVGIQKLVPGKVGAIMVGSREELYGAYEKAFGHKYPIDTPYSQIADWQLSSSITELRERYKLPPLEN